MQNFGYNCIPFAQLICARVTRPLNTAARDQFKGLATQDSIARSLFSAGHYLVQALILQVITPCAKKWSGYTRLQDSPYKYGMEHYKTLNGVKHVEE